jgi:MFS family permease
MGNAFKKGEHAWWLDAHRRYFARQAAREWSAGGSVSATRRKTARANEFPTASAHRTGGRVAAVLDGYGGLRRVASRRAVTKVTMGIIFSTYVWAYAAFQVPGGWLGDRFGARKVLTIIVSYWSIMTAATASATGAVSFVVLR